MLINAITDIKTLYFARQRFFLLLIIRQRAAINGAIHHCRLSAFVRSPAYFDVAAAKWEQNDETNP